MNAHLSQFTRRLTLTILMASVAFPLTAAHASSAVITVHKNPDCGCCGKWVAHLERAGFSVEVIETDQLEDLNKKLGVPDKLVACHTAEVAGYVIEGHVPAKAIRRLLVLKPHAIGLAVPGMPMGSPGMESSGAQPFDVLIFDAHGFRKFMSFPGDKHAA